MIICPVIRNRLRMNVNVPNEMENFMLKVYGRLDIGDEPRSPFIIRQIPNEFTKSPTIKNKYLLKTSIKLLLFFILFLFAKLEVMRYMMLVGTDQTNLSERVIFSIFTV